MSEHEIEVTEEMVQAGLKAQSEGTIEGLDDESCEKALRADLTRAYRAMYRAMPPGVFKKLPPLVLQEVPDSIPLSNERPASVRFEGGNSETCEVRLLVRQNFPWTQILRWEPGMNAEDHVRRVAQAVLDSIDQK